MNLYRKLTCALIVSLFTLSGCSNGNTKSKVKTTGGTTINASQTNLATASETISPTNSVTNQNSPSPIASNIKDNKIFGAGFDHGVINPNHLKEFDDLLKSYSQQINSLSSEISLLDDWEKSEKLIDQKVFSKDSFFNRKYYVFDSSKYIGEFEGNISYNVFYGNFYIKLKGLESSKQCVAISSKINPFIRKVATTKSFDQKIENKLSALLVSKGAIQKEIQLSQGFTCDLDGDNKTEKIAVYSTYGSNEDKQLDNIASSKAGIFDESGNLIQYLDENNPSALKVDAIMDINGDGLMEILVWDGVTGSEDSTNRIFQYKNGKIAEINSSLDSFKRN